jgi:phosphoglycolate phosphatase
MQTAPASPAPTPRGPWQLAVFDLDGTLVDTQEDLLESLGDTLAATLGGEGFSALARARARGALHLGMPAMIHAALGDLQKDGNRMRVLEERYLQNYSARIALKSRVYPGVRETLNWLRERGIGLALCSNKPIGMTHRLLEALDLARWFPIVVGPESTGWPKPHPEPLWFAASESNVARARAVMIGDSVVDQQCARAAGMGCWLYRGGYDPSVAAAAPLQFARFEELCEPMYWPTVLRRRRSPFP